MFHTRITSKLFANVGGLKSLILSIFLNQGYFGMKFDYVIVGAGSAGCAIANRLSAGSDISVALLEAGGEDRSPWIHIPVGYFKTMGNPKTDWCYKTEADPGLNGRAINWPRGKVLGGSSSINGLLYAVSYTHLTLPTNREV